MLKILKTLKLLLPALIPSWNFFDIIAPSPRIEFRLLETLQETLQVPSMQWQEFRPRPAYISITTMLKRLFWNPKWTETLFLMSCAERLMEAPTDHSYQIIVNGIQAGLNQSSFDLTTKPYCQFRLVFVGRHSTNADNNNGNNNDIQLEKQVTYLSPVFSLSQEVVA